MQKQQNTIKAVIFDCFGVLVEASLKAFYNNHMDGKHAEIAEVEERMEASNRGEISFDEWLEFLAGKSGVSFEQVSKEVSINPRNEQLLDYISKELKPHYKIGFLSNAADNWLDELFLPEDLELFDSKVLSYQTGYAKPEEQIFQISADELGLRMDECIFIDDRPDYADGARQVGMHTIVYKDFEQFKDELTEILK